MKVLGLYVDFHPSLVKSFRIYSFVLVTFVTVRKEKEKVANVNSLEPSIGLLVKQVRRTVYEVDRILERRAPIGGLSCIAKPIHPYPIPV